MQHYRSHKLQDFFLMKEALLNCFSDNSTSCQFTISSYKYLDIAQSSYKTVTSIAKEKYERECIPKEDVGSVGVPASLKLAPGVDTQPAPGVGASKGLPLGVSGCNNYKWHKSMQHHSSREGSMNKISQVNECAKNKKDICKSDHKPDIEELRYGYPKCWDLPHPNHCSYRKQHQPIENHYWLKIFLANQISIKSFNHLHPKMFILVLKANAECENPNINIYRSHLNTDNPAPLHFIWYNCPQLS